MRENPANKVWQDTLAAAMMGDVSQPRAMQVRELIAAQYRVPMPAFLDLKARKVNVPFMFAEAAWILSGSNRLSEITPYLPGYARFSDDGTFMRGGYGPQFVDQLPWAVDQIVKDNDSRQVVIDIWRKRPGESKDIPCTCIVQFLVRNKLLHASVYMRSNDVVLGMTYDIFTFSMMAKAVQLLLRDRGFFFALGTLTVTAGSLHIYDDKWGKVDGWIGAEDRDPAIGHMVERLEASATYEHLIERLRMCVEMAVEAKL